MSQGASAKNYLSLELVAVNRIINRIVALKHLASLKISGKIVFHCEKLLVVINYCINIKQYLLSATARMCNSSKQLYGHNITCINSALCQLITSLIIVKCHVILVLTTPVYAVLLWILANLVNICVHVYTLYFDVCIYCPNLLAFHDYLICLHWLCACM